VNWHRIEFEGNSNTDPTWTPLCRVLGKRTAPLTRFEVTYVAERSEVDLLDAFVARSIVALEQLSVDELTELLGFPNQDFCRTSVERLVDLGAAQLDGNTILAGPAAQQMVADGQGFRLETQAFDAVRLPDRSLERVAEVWQLIDEGEACEPTQADRTDISWLQKHESMPCESDILEILEVRGPGWVAARDCTLEFVILNDTATDLTILVRELDGSSWIPAAWVPDEAIDLAQEALDNWQEEHGTQAELLPAPGKVPSTEGDTILKYFRADQGKDALLQLIRDARRELFLLFPFVSWAAREFVEPLRKFLDRGGRLLILWGINKTRQSDQEQFNHNAEALALLEDLQDHKNGLAQVLWFGLNHSKVALADKQLGLRGSHNMLSFAGRPGRDGERVRLEMTELVRGPGSFQFLLDSERDFVEPLAQALRNVKDVTSTSGLGDATTRATWLAAFGRLHEACDVIQEAASPEGATGRFWNALEHFLETASWHHTDGTALNPEYETVLAKLGTRLGDQLENRKRKRLKRIFKDCRIRL